MDGFEFIAALTSALAWPLVLVVGVLTFRRAIIRLIDRLKNAELERGDSVIRVGFTEAVEIAKEEADRANLPPPQTTGPPHLDEAANPWGQARAIAPSAPSASVLLAWSLLERELRLAGKKAGAKGLGNYFTVANIEALVLSGVLDRTSAQIVRDLRALRNSLSHGHGISEVTAESAREYVDLADRLSRSFAERRGVSLVS